VSHLQQERVELLQELHHQARSALLDKDINSARQVDAVHEEVVAEEAKSGKSRPSTAFHGDNCYPYDSVYLLLLLDASARQVLPVLLPTIYDKSFNNYTIASSIITQKKITNPVLT
jgi:hypothetical protein